MISKVWNSELNGYKRKDFLKKLFGELFIFTTVKSSSSRCRSHVQEIIKIYLDDICKHSSSHNIINIIQALKVLDFKHHMIEYTLQTKHPSFHNIIIRALIVLDFNIT
jgi:hypothetical protein